MRRRKQTIPKPFPRRLNNVATPNYMDIIVQTFWPLKRALRFVKLYKYIYEYVQVCIRGLLVNNVV